jgi:uncharacterized protein (DUF342 family)
VISLSLSLSFARSLTPHPEQAEADLSATIASNERAVKDIRAERDALKHKLSLMHSRYIVSVCVCVCVCV